MAPISVTLTRREPPAAVVALVGEHDAYSSQLVLAGDFTQVHQILSLTGLGSGFASFSKVDDALSAVRPARSVEAA